MERSLGAVQSLGGSDEELCSAQREVLSLRAMDTWWDTEWEYLQVGADSPQDIIDAVTRDEGYKDVLQEKEVSCWERFPPS